MKKKTIIAVILLTLGWFPFMLIALWGWKEYGVLIVLSGLIICIPSAFIVATSVSDEKIWLDKSRINEEIESLKEAKKSYEMATRAFALQFLKRNKTDENK